MRWLLDSSVVIALMDEAHDWHSPVEAWLLGVEHIATCPITEGALVRYMVRQAQSTTSVKAVLSQLSSYSGHEFWPDSLPYSDTDLTQVIGHRQVTDAYLVSLVRQHGPDARLATLDEGLAKLYPDVVTLVGSE